MHKPYMQWLSPLYMIFVIGAAMMYGSWAGADTYSPQGQQRDDCMDMISKYVVVQRQLRDLKYLSQTKMLTLPKLEGVLARIEVLGEEKQTIINRKRELCNAKRIE